MNGSQPPKRSGGDDLSPAVALPIMAFGLLGFWWWQLGHRARMDWLSGIGRASGYPPVPKDMVAQIEWLFTNRSNDLVGMFPLFLMAAAAGLLEGSARRQTEQLSGFGLRRKNVGRALLILWLGLVAASIAAPVAVPYAAVGTVLALALAAATYNMARGRQRVR